MENGRRPAALAITLLLLSACAGQHADKPAPGPGPAATPAATELTAKDCEAQGHTVVGDIGDGAIHHPEYLCPQTGAPPIATIVAEPGGPIGVEGSVCC